MPKDGNKQENKKNHSTLEHSVYKELEQQYEQLNDANEYSELTTALKSLLEIIKPHYQTRNNKGAYFPMTKKQRQELLKQYENCMKICRKEQEKDANNANVIDQSSQILSKLKRVLYQDYIALNSLSDNNLPSLESVISGSRVKNINLDPSKLNSKLAGAMSSRLAIQYTDKDGNVHQGVFTKDENVEEGIWKTTLQDCFDLIEQYRVDYNTKAVLKQATQKLSESTEFTNFLINTKDVDEAFYSQILNYVDGDLKRVLSEVKDNYDYNYYYNHLFSNMKKTVEELYKNYDKTGLKPDNKIAQRNCAMSDVAGFLGFSHLLANSRRVRVSTNGTDYIDGVIMEAAGGDCVDLNRLIKDSPYINITEKELSNNNIKKSLADLQILDFICGNTDRHSGNYFIRLDSTDPRHPKAIGVLGIDNDSSFGDINDGGMMRLAKLDDIKVISVEMKNAIDKMTPEILQTILLPYDLKAAQMTAAITRLNNLKRAIQKKNIEIINSNADWTKFKLNSAANTKGKLEGGHRNIFGLHFNDVIKEVNNDKKSIENSIKQPVLYARQKNDKDWVREGRIERNKKPYDELIADLKREYNLLNLQYQRLIDPQGGKKAKGGSVQFTNMARAFDAVMQGYENIRSLEQHPNIVDDDKKKRLLGIMDNLDKNKKDLKDYAENYFKKIDENWHHIYEYGKVRRDVSHEVFKTLNYFEMEQSVNEYDVTNYVNNQLHSMMTDNLRTNISVMKQNSRRYGLGVKALDAQEHLWNIAQRKDREFEPEVDAETGAIKLDKDKVPLTVSKDIMLDKTEIISVLRDIEILTNYNDELSKVRDNLAIPSLNLEDTNNIAEVKIPIRKVKEFLNEHIKFEAERKKEIETKVKEQQNKEKVEVKPIRIRKY